VHDAVIVAEREEGSLADRDRVHAVRRHDDRALLDRTGPENRGSALRDDGHADDRAEHAGIRDRERRTLDLVGLELALAGARGEVVDAARDAHEVELVGVLHHRYDEPGVQVDGHADVDVAAIEQVVATHGRVHHRVLRQHLGHGPRDEGRVADLHALLLPACSVRLTHAIDRREIDLDERVHVRRDALGAHHVSGGEATGAVHRLDAVTLARRELRVPDLPVERLPELVAAAAGTARRLRRGWRGRRSRPRGGGGRLPCIAGGRGRTLLQERHDVVLRYATTAAGALDLRDV